jgi:2-isopropylmalate synthase
MGKIRLYDTTLRDGMQAEGVSFSLEDKLAIATRLDELGLDYIEGGYAASNPKEAQFFAEVAKLGLKNSKIRADRGVSDDVSLNAMLACKTAAGTLVGKSWDMQVTDVLGCSLDENLTICAESVEYLKKHGLEVIFDAEHFYDGYKANPEYAMKVLAAAANAGADALVLCDTNGGCLPGDVCRITRAVCEQFGGVETINGLGERCGNANLCTVIPNIQFKTDHDVLSAEKIRTLTEVSRYVFEICNVTPVMNMPYVGESAFAHKGGLHVNALRKSKGSYEHVSPELVGNERRFLISELSGKSNVLAELEKAKIVEDKELAQKILTRVQELENEGYQFEAADASFDLLVKKIMGTYKPFFKLMKYRVSVERHSWDVLVTEATVKLTVDGVTEHIVGEGDGPVNALDAALRKALKSFYPSIEDIHLIDYKVRVVNAREGTAAKVRVIIESMDKNAMWGTVGVSENIIEASWKALVDSVEYKLQKDLT